MVKGFRHAVLRVIIISALSCNLFSAVDNSHLSISFLGKSRGEFVDPTGEAQMTTTGLGTDDFTWGKKSSLSEANRVKFKGTEFTTHYDEVFIVGNIVYGNRDTKIGTNATTVDLKIILKFENGSRVDFLVPMELISTPNNSSLQKNADILRIYRNKYNNRFELAGKAYMMELSFGEATSDGFTSVDQFHVYEGFAASAQLLARIKEHHEGASHLLTHRPGDVPEPPPPAEPEAKLEFKFPDPPKQSGKLPREDPTEYLTLGQFTVQHAVAFGFQSTVGRVYQPQVSSDNIHWSDWGESVRGDGKYKTIYKPIDDAYIPAYRIKVTPR